MAAVDAVAPPPQENGTTQEEEATVLNSVAEKPRKKSVKIKVSIN